MSNVKACTVSLEMPELHVCSERVPRYPPSRLTKSLVGGTFLTLACYVPSEPSTCDVTQENLLIDVMNDVPLVCLRALQLIALNHFLVPSNMNDLPLACLHAFMQVIAQNLQKYDPKTDGAKRDWVAIYDECASVLYEVSSAY